VRLSLPFRDINANLRDIVQAIDHIDTFLGAMTFESYQSDLKTKAAVERKMQIITEAAVRLGDEAPLLSRISTGKASAVWETFFGTPTTVSMTRWYGTPSRRNCHRCERLSLRRCSEKQVSERPTEVVLLFS
jgi:hypothetical protein